MELTSLPFLKVQATGNDFVLVEACDGIEDDWPALARALCDRHRGVGADGLLVLLPSDHYDARMRMFNPDGTEDMCGNGLRGLVRYLGLPQARIDTRIGVLDARLEEDRVSLTLPPPRFEAEALPAALPPGARVWNHPLTVAGREVRLFGVNTGTTHAVIFEPDLSDSDFQMLSPLIETSALYPERTSICWTTVIGRTALHARVWERGVGETLACGTGAGAVVAVAHALGLTDRHVVVTMRGGQLTVALHEDGALALSGPATIVFRGRWPVSGAGAQG